MKVKSVSVKVFAVQMFIQNASQRLYKQKTKLFSVLANFELLSKKMNAIFTCTQKIKQNVLFPYSCFVLYNNYK